MGKLGLLVGLLAIGCGDPAVTTTPGGEGGSAGALQATGGAPSTGGTVQTPEGGAGGLGGMGGQNEPDPTGFGSECADHVECPSSYEGTSVGSYRQCARFPEASSPFRCTFRCGDVTTGGEVLSPTRVALCQEIGGECQPVPGVVGGIHVCQ